MQHVSSATQTTTRVAFLSHNVAKHEETTRTVAFVTQRLLASAFNGRPHPIRHPGNRLGPGLNTQVI